MQEKEFVTFKLSDDPQEYKLFYDFNQIVEAEKETGTNLLRAMEMGMTATECRALLYACLKTAHPQVLLVEAGDLVTKAHNTVMQSLGQVLILQKEKQELPSEEEEPEEYPAAVGA